MLRSYVKGPRRTLPSHYFMNYARCKQCDNRVMWVACASTNPSDSPDAACPNPNSPSTGPWWLLGASWRTWGGRRRRQPCRPRRRHRYWCWVSGWACPWWWWVSDVRIALLAIGALSAWRFRWLLWKIERFLGPWGQGQCGGGWPTAVCVYMCIYNIPCVVWVGALECLHAIMDYGTEWQSLYAMLAVANSLFKFTFRYARTQQDNSQHSLVFQSMHNWWTNFKGLIFTFTFCQLRSQRNFDCQRAGLLPNKKYLRAGRI